MEILRDLFMCVLMHHGDIKSFVYVCSHASWRYQESCFCVFLCIMKIWRVLFMCVLMHLGDIKRFVSVCSYASWRYQEFCFCVFLCIMEISRVLFMCVLMHLGDIKRCVHVYIVMLEIWNVSVFNISRIEFVYFLCFVLSEFEINQTSWR